MPVQCRRPVFHTDRKQAWVWTALVGQLKKTMWNGTALTFWRSALKKDRFSTGNGMKVCRIWEQTGRTTQKNTPNQQKHTQQPRRTDSAVVGETMQTVQRSSRQCSTENDSIIIKNCTQTWWRGGSMTHQPWKKYEYTRPTTNKRKFFAITAATSKIKKKTFSLNPY